MDTNAINSIFQEFRKQIEELKQENKDLWERLECVEGILKRHIRREMKE